MGFLCLEVGTQLGNVLTHCREFHGASVGLCVQRLEFGLDGLVKDFQGALVPNAQVTVVNTLTQQTFSAVADDKGHWAVPALPTAT